MSGEIWVFQRTKAKQREGKSSSKQKGEGKKGQKKQRREKESGHTKGGQSNSINKEKTTTTPTTADSQRGNTGVQIVGGKESRMAQNKEDLEQEDDYLWLDEELDAAAIYDATDEDYVRCTQDRLQPMSLILRMICVTVHLSWKMMTLKTVRNSLHWGGKYAKTFSGLT